MCLINVACYSCVYYRIVHARALCFDSNKIPIKNGVYFIILGARILFSQFVRGVTSMWNLITYTTLFHDAFRAFYYLYYMKSKLLRAKRTRTLRKHARIPSTIKFHLYTRRGNKHLLSIIQDKYDKTLALYCSLQSLNKSASRLPSRKRMKKEK